MDSAEFDRLIERARNPRLIPGIYNYCDGRCPRCAFTERCLTHLDGQERDAAGGDDQRSLAEGAGDAIGRTLEMLAEIGRREGIDLQQLADDAKACAADKPVDPHREDPLAVRALEYGQLAWRISRAIAPVVDLRGDARVVAAVETIGWFSTLISAKVCRAIGGLTGECEPAGELQTDFNGSAKVALIGIGESRRAWAVLMEAGRATANGVPAQAVAMLEALEAEVATRSPRAMAFVRPGFDEPDLVSEGGGV
jgi:hypothetical protein